MTFSRHFRSPDERVRRLTDASRDDAPLDAFDMELLAGAPRPETPVRGQDLARVSLPPKWRIDERPQGSLRPSHEGLIGTNALLQSSSSPYEPFSSPTISALQQQRLYRDRYATSRDRRANTQESRRSRDQDTYKTTLLSGDSLPSGPSARISNDSGTLSSQRPPQTYTSFSHPQQANELGHETPVVQGIPLIATTDLPDQLRSLFQQSLFNAVQSKCFEVAFRTDDNLVLSAPTGSGKTAVLELAICRLLVVHKNKDFKVVYQAPTKSLCTERFRDWQSRFGVVDLQCAELTGDTDCSNLKAVQSANVIITTPEKWDSVTRKWTDHVKLMRMVKLFLVDEVHILKESRGATLEAVVSRMKHDGSDVRFIALSATVPNSEDIATWLGKSSHEQHLPARREVFSEDFRPAKLEKHVYGYSGPANDFAFETTLTKVLPDIIARHAKRKPVMVFCATRKICVETSVRLTETWNGTVLQQRLWAAPTQVLDVKDPDLKKTVTSGVGFHHGGMDPDDRHAVEQGYLSGQISIICSTSTLAVGVNLPCYLVILKGTFTYNDKGLQEYSDLEVMQMLGRAGRPQFERSACAAILTRSERVHRYEKMISGQELLESCLHLNLIEHLNAEIGLGTIYDTATAEKWLSGTFLSVRLQQNPDHYKLQEDVDSTVKDSLLAQICAKDVHLLQEAKLIQTDVGLKCTEFGNIMARYYVKFDTMKLFMALPPRAKVSEILNVLAQAIEFRDIRMRAAEKSFLKDINKDSAIKFPIKVDIALHAHKVSLTIQAELGGVDMRTWKSFATHGLQFALDKAAIFTHANRLIRCLIDCQIAREDGVGVRNALELGRSLAAQVWDNTALQLKQLDGVGPITVRKLAATGVNSLEALSNAEAHQIEMALGKSQPFGHQLLQKAASFPNLRVSVKRLSTRSRVKGVEVKFQAQIGFLNQQPPTMFRKKPIYVCFLAESSTGALVDFRRFGATKLKNGAEFLVTMMLDKPTSHVNCHVMCDEIAGTSRYAELKLEDIRACQFPRVGSPTVPIARKKEGNDEDEFENCGIEDSVWDEVDLTGVQDIDNIIPETKANTKRKRNTSNLGSLTKDNQTHPSDTETREPVQMSNGRWTCRHDCNEKNKDCKHKCCREGVEKPRALQKKVSKDESKAQEDGSVGLPKRRKLSLSSDEHVETKSKDPKTVSSHAEPARNTESQPAFQQESTTTFSARQEAHYVGRDDGSLINVDEDGLPAPQDLLTDCTLPATGSNIVENEDSLVNQENSMDADLGFDDCDWTFGGTEGAAFEQNIETTLPSKAHNTSTETTTSEMHEDMGGFEAPLSHVAMSEVERKPEKGLFITGESSSPEKASTVATQATFCKNENNVLGRTAFDHNDIQDIRAFPAALPGPTKDAPAYKAELPSCDTNNEQDPAASTAETEEERKRRLWEEDQKKKWEGIDPEMYRMFGGFVELI